MSALEKFNRGREGLKPFLINIDLYYRFNSLLNDQDKLLIASIYIKDKAAIQVQPIVDDYLNNKVKDYQDNTKTAFKSQIDFKKEITKVFRELDKELQVEQKISRI